MNEYTCDHLLRLDWSNLDTDIAYDKSGICRDLKIEQSYFDQLMKRFHIVPIQDIDQEELFPKSWKQKLALLIEADRNGKLDEIYIHLDSWFPKDLMPRMKLLLNYFCKNADTPCTLCVWKAYKKLISEPLMSTHGYSENETESIYARSYQKSLFKLFLNRQFETFYPPTDDHDSILLGGHESFSNFEVTLTYDLTEDLTDKKLDKILYNHNSKEERKQIENNVEESDVFKILSGKNPVNMDVCYYWE